MAVVVWSAWCCRRRLRLRCWLLQLDNYVLLLWLQGLQLLYQCVVGGRLRRLPLQSDYGHTLKTHGQIFDKKNLSIACLR